SVTPRRSRSNPLGSQLTSWVGLRVHDSLPRWFVTCNADGQVPAHVAEKENDPFRRTHYARTLSNGFDVGASTPPAFSSVTSTCAPGATRRCNANVFPEN